MGEVRPWWSAWAKSIRDPDDHETVTEWLPLHDHLADAAAVAELLAARWVPRVVLERIADDLGATMDDVVVMLRWLAAVHDVGKISPAFASQVPALTGSMHDLGLLIKRGTAESSDRSFVRHERVGEIAVREALIAKGAGHVAAGQLASVVGAHHGVPPSRSQMQAVAAHRDLVGRGNWADARRDAVDWATAHVGASAVLAHAGRARLSMPAQVLCSAVVIMADWVASNADLFPLEPPETISVTSTGPDAGRTAARAREAWAALALPPRWQPPTLTDAAAAFTARFGRPAKSMRPAQRAAVEAAVAQERPGLVVLEAPMGEGKTEAALLAAEALAARSGAEGCFVALPTRATSDAMFGRVLRWMQKLPGLPGEVSVMLAHGTSGLNDEFRGLANPSRFAAVGEDGDEVGVVHRWLRGRRRGPLAQFVVGTVDQVLLAALRSRHLMLRHLALAGKVVIIDEVHAYDVYMATYLDRALHWLGAYGTPVVLLSATLPAARRAELVRAYESGRESPAPAHHAVAEGYPLITATGMSPVSVPAGLDARAVHLERLADGEEADLDDLVALLRDALSGGGCAVVIRNTVARVQVTADRLVAEFGDDAVTVAHSRFLAVDRARLDTELLRRFGPPGPTTARPEKHIVVASQVVEQSLDVDFDVMVTDLAPIDLMLQRMGRLHRHARQRPERLLTPRILITGVNDWSGEPVIASRGSRAVYGEHPLLRSAALLVDRAAITVPDDIAPLVQSAYGDDMVGPPEWQDAMAQARRTWDERAQRRRDEAGKFLLEEVGSFRSTLDGWLHTHAGDGEDERDTRFTGHVRDGAESLEVLVVQDDGSEGLLVAGWVPGGGTQIPMFGEIDGLLARRIAGCALRLPIAMSGLDAVGDGVVAALERRRYASFDQTPLLAGHLVLVLDEDRTAELHHGAAHFRLTYDLRRGLLHDRVAPP